MKTDSEKIRSQRKWESVATYATLGLYFIVLSWIIIFKCNLLTNDMRFGYRFLTLIPFETLIEGGWKFFIECVLNALVFAPFGYLVCCVSNRHALVVASVLSLVLSAFCEAFQYIFAFGSTDVTDVIFNALGGVLGGAIFLLFARIIPLRGRRGIIAVALALLLPISIYAVASTLAVFPVYIIK